MTRKNTTDKSSRLAFVVHFVQLDLDRLRPGDRLNLEDDLARFLEPDAQGPGLYAVAVGVPGIATGELSALQATMRAIVTSYLELREGRRRAADLYEIHLRKMITPQGTPGGPPRVVATGEVRDVALEVLFSVLASVEADRLRRCPECGTIFLRMRKQLYCTRKCVNKANKRAWLATPKGRRASRSHRRRAYERQQHKKYGPKVKVGEHKTRKGSRP